MINIIVPLALPSLGPIPVLLLTAPAPTYRHAIFLTVKDGQLGWGVVAMGLSTTYELAEAAVAGHVVHTRLVFAVFLALLMALFAICIAAAGAVYPVAVGARAPGSSWVAHYKVLTASFIAAVVAGTAFSYVHFGVAR